MKLLPVLFLLLALIAASLPVAAAEEITGDVTPQETTPVHTLPPVTEPPLPPEPVTPVRTTEPFVPVTMPETTEPFEPVTPPVTREPFPPVTLPEPPAPVEKSGWLTIISTPSGATVTIDGSPAGITPVSGFELEAGSHTVRLSMAGYLPYETTKAIRAGVQEAIDAQLTERQVPPEPTTPLPTVYPTRTETPVPPVPCVGCDRGWIRVSSNVDGAQVSFEGTPACTTSGGSCDTQVVTTGTPYRTFTVQKSGYRIFNGAVTAWPGKGETVNLYATLDPIPPVPSYGSIRVVSHPSGAVVTLDGGTWQYTPATFTQVSAGSSHYLQITMSGYQPYGTSAYVSAGQTATVDAYLARKDPYPVTGSLSIVTTPPGADIYIDSTYFAESPYVVSGLTPGSHILRLYKAGYDEYLQPVTISEGRQVQTSVALSPQYARVGSIEVGSVPPGSAVYLDGNYMGQTPQGSYTDLTSVTEGTHTLVLRQTDFRDYSQSVFVKGGGIVTVMAQMVPNPAPVPDATGQIIVASSPSGAELFLDNTFRGVTPATLPDIPAGPHLLTVKQSGFADATQTVTVTGGQSVPVAVTLAEIPRTTKAPLSVLPVTGALAVILFLVSGRKN